MDSTEKYDQWHEKLEVDVAADAPWHLMVRDYLSTTNISAQRLLEIGCGRGGFACWLASQSTRPMEIVAVDFSETAVEKGRKRAEELALIGVRFEVGDIQAIAYGNETFDLVMSSETIEHVPVPMQALRELYRVLRPGGRLILTTPNYFNLMGLYRIYRRAVGRPFTEGGQPINHVVMLPRTLRWLRLAGFKVMKTQTSGHYIPIPGRPPPRLASLDRLGWLTKPFGLHSMFVAVKMTSRLP